MPPSDDIVPDPAVPIDPVQHEAADWFLRRKLGLTPAQEMEFNRWLGADFRHAQLYRENEYTWTRLRQMSAEYEPALANSRIGKSNWMRSALAAAAALAVAAFYWHSHTERRPAFAQIVATDIGLLRRVQLPDGSVVQMNADSMVEVRFGLTERRIVLQRGEAIFQVAKNHAWPFIVKAGTVELRAVGTAFDVRLRSDAVDLVVTEGKVGLTDIASNGEHEKFGPPEERMEIGAGQHLHILLRGENQAQPLPVENLGAEAIRDALAWQKHSLVFHADRLVDIVSEFNRFNRRKLGIGSPELAERRYGGTFPADDYEGFVKVLEKENDIFDVRSPTSIELKLVRRDLARSSREPPLASAPGLPDRLVFNADRLIDIVAAFNRYNQHQLVIDDAELGSLRFGGAFPPNDYKTFVRVLQASFGVMAVSTDGETRLSLRGRAERPKKNP